MTSFCSQRDANALGWKDFHIESGTPAIQMHIGECLPAEIHGTGSAVENEEQQSPHAATNAQAGAGTAQTPSESPALSGLHGSSLLPGVTRQILF